MNINLHCPCNPMGYGVAGLQLMLALNRLGHIITWWPIGRIHVEDTYRPILDRLLRNQDSFDKNSPCVKIWHQFDMGTMVGHGQHIGMPIFELNTLTERERHHLNSLDKIFVCSHWAMEIIQLNLIDRIRDVYVVPLGVDRDIFNEHIGVAQRGWTTFLNIGKWEMRKGHDILADAFNKAFSLKDKVRLWMMNDSPFLSPEQTQEWQARYTNGRLRSKISFIPRVETQKEVAQIMAEVTAGVFPAKAEGWNLELLEMMSVGKPVIATNYSAHKEFVNTDNAYLIEIDKLESAEDNMWFHKEGEWAHLGDEQIDQIIQHMRKIHKLNQNDEIVNIAGIETAKKFTWKAAAERMITCINMDKTDY